MGKNAKWEERTKRREVGLVGKRTKGGDERRDTEEKRR